MIEFGNICQACSCKCYIVTIKCLLANSQLKSLKNDTNATKDYLDIAQTKYIYPLISGCEDILCEAIRKNALPINHEDYEELPTIWSNFIDKSFQALVAAIRYLNFLDKDGEYMTNDTSITMYNHKLLRYQAMLDDELTILKNYIKDHQTDYTCVESDDCCDNCEEESQVTNYWYTTKKSRWQR